MALRADCRGLRTCYIIRRSAYPADRANLAPGPQAGGFLLERIATQMNEINTHHRGLSPFSREDIWTAIASLAVAMARLIPFRSRMACLWDSAEFSVAIGGYEIGGRQGLRPGTDPRRRGRDDGRRIG